jgi:hypothetical protein
MVSTAGAMADGSGLGAKIIIAVPSGLTVMLPSVVRA